jgi:hypothetical protein
MAAYDRMESAILGLPYGLDYEVDSVVASAAITPGRPVYQTPGSPETGKSTYASGDVFLGIAVVAQKSHIADVGTYASGDVVNVLRSGKIWVQVATAVSGAPAAAYATSAGLFAPTASGNYNVGALFRTNQTTVSGLAVIEVAGTKVVA